jgi:hypothetical protein
LKQIENEIKIKSIKYYTKNEEKYCYDIFQLSDPQLRINFKNSNIDIKNLITFIKDFIEIDDEILECESTLNIIDCENVDIKILNWDKFNNFILENNLKNIDRLQKKKKDIVLKSNDDDFKNDGLKGKTYEKIIKSKNQCFFQKIIIGKVEDKPNYHFKMVFNYFDQLFECYTFYQDCYDACKNFN